MSACLTMPGMPSEIGPSSASGKAQRLARLYEELGDWEKLRELLPSLVQLEDAARGQFARHMTEVSDSQLIALACQILEISSARKQEVLEAASVTDRFLMLYEDLYRHLDVNPEMEHLDPDQLN